jgi:hypothetical protein
MSDQRAKSAHGKPPSVEIDRSLSFQREVSQKAYRYWRSVQGDRAMPARADITPAGMKDILPCVGLVDVPRDGSNGYSLRLAGDAIQRVFGPITGKPIKDVFPPDVAERWISAFDTTVNEGAPLRFMGRVLGKAFLQYELFIAPLGDGGTITTLFGALEVWPVEMP